MFRAKVVANIDTHVLCSILFREIMWKNILEPERAQNYDVIRRMRIACCIPKAIYTHSQYVTFIAFLLLNWFKESSSILRYTYIACLVEYRISCAQHTDSSYYVKLQYTKT